MARCPGCNKFAPLNFEEPEVQDGPEVDDSGHVTAEVRIYRTSECCGEEMKEAMLNLEGDIPEEIIAAHTGEDHELSAEEAGIEQLEEGGGRYAKSFFGATLTYTIKCSCQKDGDEPLYTGDLSDKVAASGMDDMC